MREINEQLFYIIAFVILKINSFFLDPKIFAIIFFIIFFMFTVFYLLSDKQITKSLKRNYFTWGKGAGAELAVKRSLSSLEGNYKIIDDIQSGTGNVDLVCVGSTGVFAVEVKSHRGCISWNGGLLRNGNQFNKDFIRQTYGGVYYIKNLLKEKLGKEYFVQGILEFNNAKIDTRCINGQKEGVWVGGRGFARWVVLERGKENLSTKEIEKIYNCLREFKEKSNK